MGKKAAWWQSVSETHVTPYVRWMQSPKPYLIALGLALIGLAGFYVVSHR